MSILAVVALFISGLWYQSFLKRDAAEKDGEKCPAPEKQP